MKKENTPYKTYTVKGSNSASRPDGRACLILHTTEEGQVAFEVSIQAVQALQKQLATISMFLQKDDAIQQ